jgi:nucleoside-diphosphate kinase
MKSHPKHERTLVVLKPDALQRGLIGEVLHRYERIGLKLVAVKMLVPTAEHIEKHYTLDPEWRKKTGEKTIQSYKDKGLIPPYTDPLKVTSILLKRLVAYMAAGPVIATVWQGAHAVAIVRKITGGTEPLTSPIGTIRGDYVLDSYATSDTDDRSIRNIVHVSGSVKEAQDEIMHWFKKEEIIDYNASVEDMLYGLDLKQILK